MPEELQLLPEDKERENEIGIVIIYLETIALLCTTRQARDLLREKKVYPVIRELHLISGDNKVIQLCEKIVNLLMRNEEDENRPGNKVPQIEEIPYDMCNDSDDEIEVL